MIVAFLRLKCNFRSRSARCCAIIRVTIRVRKGWNAMQAFKKVDMENWPRREHYRYYTEALKV